MFPLVGEGTFSEWFCDFLVGPRVVTGQICMFWGKAAKKVFVCSV